MLVLLLPMMPTSSAVTENAPEAADASPSVVTDAHEDFTTDFSAVPMSPRDATAPFTMSPSSGDPIALGVETVAFSARDSPSVLQGQSEDDHGGHLGNAPEALYKVLQKFLDRGVNPPAHFPVPYLVYTKSGTTELFTDVLTKMPIMINVDDSSSTGQGGKDIKVLTTISVNPLVITSRVQLLGSTHATDLRIIVAFPAFFYNGEAGAPDGEPFWLFGYETLVGSQIPLDISMVFTVDVTLGSEHVFDFDWDAPDGIDPLGFTLETVQLQDLPPADFSNPFYPATTYFEVSSPDFASLTFTTLETPTSSTKCMVWSAASAFLLDYTFAEAEDLGGTPVIYDMTATVDSVPTAFSACTTEDRAANTYSVDYVANAVVELFEIVTNIDIGGIVTVTIDLAIEDMPAEIHMVLDGSGVGTITLDVDVSSNVGLLRLDATAAAGLADVSEAIGLRLHIADIPDFTASAFISAAGNGVSLDAPSCIGSLEFAFADDDGVIVLPAEHAGDPDSHYLFAQSDAAKTAIALRIVDLSHLGFVQDNNDQSNTLTLSTCAAHVLYVLVDTTEGSYLTSTRNVDLRVVVDSVPTELSVTWTVPFTLSVGTNGAIDSVVADLTTWTDSELAADALVAHAEILDIPADMTWDIDPAGSIAFTADGSIGTVLLNAADPNGLPGAGSFFAGSPLRLLSLTAHGLPSFTATWSSEDVTPWTSVAFNTAPSTALDDLVFAVTSGDSFVTTSGFGIENRGMFYNDDSVDLGHGFAMDASIWIRVEDITRAEIAWGGADTTIDVGYGTSIAHELKVAARLDGTSSLNPAAPRAFVGSIRTSALPTSMDLTLTPETSFTYVASAEIASVIVDATVGESPSTDIDVIHGEIEGIPATASGQWTANSFALQLASLSTLDRIFLEVTNGDGVFGTAYLRVEAEILEVPDDVSADWDLAAKTVAVDFDNGAFTGGLGSFRVLVTGQSDGDTTTYVNGLGGAPAACMTTYSDFTSDIDQAYWTQGVDGAAARQIIVDNLAATYCRDPVLDTAADDYIAFLDSADGDILVGRIRELNHASATLDEEVGTANVEFTDGVTLSRQFYFRAEDATDNDVTLLEASELPDGAGPNVLTASWNDPGNAYSYDFSEVIPFLDLWLGPSDPTGYSSSFTKMVFVDVPATGSLGWDLDSISSGFFEFLVSSEFEFGFLRQESGGKRYVGYVEMSSLHMTYTISGPGEEDCEGDYDFCYSLLDIEFNIHTHGGAVNGVFGIYTRRGGLLNLDMGTVPSNPDYVPLWTFILPGFTHFTFDFDWELGFSIDVDWCGPIPCDIDVDVSLTPVIVIDTDLNPWIDFWWNDDVSDSTSVLGITLYYSINIPDYKNIDPIDLFPFYTVNADGPSINVDLEDLSAGVTFELHGLHNQADHPNPGF